MMASDQGWKNDQSRDSVNLSILPLLQSALEHHIAVGSGWLTSFGAVTEGVLPSASGLILRNWSSVLYADTTFYRV
jgi:hypothetical protein